MSDWSNGICSCFNDCGICLIAFCCPCYQFGKNAEAVGDSCCLCCLCYLCFPCLCRCINRGKIRNQRGIGGNCCTDLCCIWFCWFCSFVQESQEVAGGQHRGYAMARE